MALLTRKIVAHILKVQPERVTEMTDVRKNPAPHTLPHIKIPGKTKPYIKYMPYALYMWQKQYAEGFFPSFEEWNQQLNADIQEFITKEKTKKTLTH